MLSCFLLLLFVGLIILLVFSLQISLLLQNRSHYLKNSLSLCVCTCMCSYTCFLFPSHLKTWVHTCCYCAGNWFSLSESLVYSVLLFLKHFTLINHQFYYFNYSLVGWVGTRVLLCISGWPGTHSQLGDFIRPWVFPFLLYPGNFFSLRWIIWNTGYIVSSVVNSNPQDT